MLLRGATPPAGVLRCRVGPGLIFDARMQEDGSWIEVFFLQYEAPALVPILETFLTPGTTFVDVGANIGVYTGWASRLVGPSGKVLAFEPLPATRDHLEQVIKMNGLDNVQLIPKAVGAALGLVTLWASPQASGLTSALTPVSGSGARPVEVPLTTLDAELAAWGGAPPVLIKIDVEGLEVRVLEGVTLTLSGPTPPALVFEAQDLYLERAGDKFADLPGWFEDQFGYRLYALKPAGLAPIARGTRSPPTLNCLALHPEHHRASLARLSRTRFRRNQNC